MMRTTGAFPAIGGTTNVPERVPDAVVSCAGCPGISCVAITLDTNGCVHRLEASASRIAVSMPLIVADEAALAQTLLDREGASPEGFGGRPLLSVFLGRFGPAFRRPFLSSFEGHRHQRRTNDEVG